MRYPTYFTVKPNEKLAGNSRSGNPSKRDYVTVRSLFRTVEMNLLLVIETRK